MAPKKAAPQAASMHAHAQPVVAQERQQEATLLIKIHSSRINLAVHASADSLSADQLVADPTLAPPLRVAVTQGSESSSGLPMAMVIGSGSSTLYPFSSEHSFRHKKGADLPQRLVNAQLLLQLCHAGDGAVLASTPLDLLPLALGASQLQDQLPLVPAEPVGSQMFRVLPGSYLQVTVQLLHHPAPSAGASDPAQELYSAVPAEEAAGCNVLQLTPGVLQPLPARFSTAVAAASGALSCSLALHLPGGMAPLVATGGVVKDGESVAWSAVPRVYLPPAAVAALQAALQAGDPLLLEVARYLAPEAPQLADPAWSAHHALFTLDCADGLQEPGACSAGAAAVPLGAFLAVAPAGLATGLPPYVAPTGPRIKPIDDPLPAATEGAPAPCTWDAAGTRLLVQLRLARPLVPPWSAPPAPRKLLAELVPPREEETSPGPPSACAEFRAQMRSLALSLAPECAHKLAVSSAAAAGPSSSGAQQHALQPDALQAMLQALSSSGQQHAIKQQVTQLVAKVVQERVRSGAAAPASTHSLLAELYAQLVEELRAAVGEALMPSQHAFGSLLEGSAAQQGAEAVRERGALQLQVEVAACEAVLNFGRAAQLLQDRVLAEGVDAQAWCDYACFCLRRGALGKAEECLHRALALEQKHAPSLSALACLSLQRGLHGVHGAWEAAEAAAHALKEADARDARSWALLGLAYKLQGAAKEAEARSCHQRVVKLSKGAAEAADTALTTATLNGYLAAAELLVALKLAAPAERALATAAGLKEAAALLDKHTRLCAAELAHVAGDSPKALASLVALQASLIEAGDTDTAAMLLSGDIQFEARNILVAKHHYLRVLQQLPSMHAGSLLRLASCMAEQGQFEAAGDIYQRVCERTPSATAWLGVGVAALRTGCLHDADLALSEANRLDAHNAVVWAFLALLALQQGAEAEAEVALNQAHMCGLHEPALLAEVSGEWARLGRWAAAEVQLLRALQLQDSVTARCQLARALLAQARCEECEQQLTAAQQLQPQSPEDERLLAETWAALRRQWPSLQ